MDLTVGVREMIAWAIALISVTMLIQSNVRNPTGQYYMALQGLLMACHKKAGFYARQADALKDSKSHTASMQESQKIYEFVANDYVVLTQHLFGVMKSIQIKADLPIDVVTFIEAGTADSSASALNSPSPYPSPEAPPNGMAPPPLPSKPLMR